MASAPLFRRAARLSGLMVGGMLLLIGSVDAAPEKGSKVYKWTDEKGEVHYGDAVPPQYADQDQTILNRQGVAVGAIAGRHSAEQVAADDAARAADAAARETQQRRMQHDRNLIATYLSTDEIETLRDRRLDILDGQARVLAQYVEQLKNRENQLEVRMQHFRPYAASPTAPALPEALAEEAVHTVDDLKAQERALLAKREEVERTRAQFADDLKRFQELKDAGRTGSAPRPH
jgi:Domain of unknown function (DUF4124)